MKKISMISMISMKSIDNFLTVFQLQPDRLEGYVIRFDDNPDLVIIVGKDTYIELNPADYHCFFESLNNISAKNDEIKQLKRDCAELKENLQSKYQIKDKQVLEALRYSVTKFALLARVSKDKKEIIDTVNKGVKDLLLFAENLAPEQDIKKLLDEKGAESA